MPPEVYWTDGEAWLVSHGSNPVLVDGCVVKKGASAWLRAGSEVVLSYETDIILRLRFARARPEPSAPQPAERGPPPQVSPPLTPGVAAALERYYFNDLLIRCD